MTRRTEPRLISISRFTVCTHDTPACCYSGIKHGLHDLSLVTMLWNTAAETLPIAPGPRGLIWQGQARYIRQQIPVILYLLPSSPNHFGNTLELLYTDGRLNIRHSIIVADRNVTIGDYSLVGIGSVVLKSIDQNCVVVGNPARMLRPLLNTNRLHSES